MALFMWQAAYTPESWATQLKNPQNRVETVGRQACESAGGKLVGAWYCFGDYDIIIVADMPDAESMAADANPNRPVDPQKPLNHRRTGDGSKKKRVNGIA